MKHITSLTRTPRRAQDEDLSLAAVFTLVSEILLAVSAAVLAKENSDLTDLTGLLGGTAGDTTT